MVLEEIKKILTTQDKRISWDEYFMSAAFLISSRSPCERLKVGCVIVKENRIISAGYNGFLPGEPHTSIVRDNHEQATVHAEQNAISDCSSRGVSVNGATAYITHYPCLHCAKILAASGIKDIKYDSDYKNDELVKKIVKVNITQLVYGLSTNIY